MHDSYRYVFHIPLYNEYSNGIQILWQFAEWVSKTRKIAIVPFEYNERSAYIPEHMRSAVEGSYVAGPRDIVIYPESVAANPLGGNRVCRYILARPYTLNGQWINYSENDYVFYYSNVVGSGGSVLNIQNKYLASQIMEYSRALKRREDKVTVYYGKLRCGLDLSVSKDLVRKFKDIDVITRKHPSNKAELYRKISESRLLISLDPLSNLCYEATLLGTPAYIADTVFESEYMNYCFPLHGFIPSKEILEVDFADYRHDDLAAQAMGQFESQVRLTEELVQEQVRKIENHFSNGAKFDYRSAVSRDRDFIQDRWGVAPIVSGTNFNSVVGYHLISINPFIYIFGKAAWRVLGMFKRSVVALIFYLPDISRRFIKSVFDFSDPVVTYYLRKAIGRPIGLPSENHLPSTHFSRGSTDAHEVFADSRIKKLILNLIWRRAWKFR